MLLVVRHADAGNQRSWKGSDRLWPLSPTGCRQAEGLVIRLEDYPVDRILSSPTLRCQQTMQPLARNRFLEVKPLAALGVDAGPTWLLQRTDRGQVYGRHLAPLVLEGLQLAGP